MTIDVVRIVAPHFVAGVIPHNGRVVSAAPILRFMIHWTGREVATYCAKKGWAWQRVECDPMQAYSASPASIGRGTCARALNHPDSATPARERKDGE